MKFILTWLRRILLVISILTGLSLMAASLAAYIPPSTAWVFSFFTLGWLFFFVLNLFFLIFWMMVKLRHMWLPLLALLISFTDFNTFFAFHFKNEQYNRNKNSLRIMTYNVRNFDLYNWSGGGETAKKMYKQIKDQSADIVCFQEYYDQDGGDYQNTKALKKITGYKYYHFEIATTLNINCNWGMSVFSRYPIVNVGRVNFTNKTNNACIYCDIKTGDSIIRVYNVHLESIHFRHRDYLYLDSLSATNARSVSGGVTVLSKMKRAYLARGKQAEAVAASIAESPYPVIVCGDFNDTPCSYSYHTIRGKLQDAFIKRGSGIGHSYYGFLPIFRIDFILPDNSFKVMSYSTIEKDYADHYPIIVDLERGK